MTKFGWPSRIFVLLLLVDAGCASNTQDRQDRVVVAAAASVADAIKELAVQFEASHQGLDIAVTGGPSNTLGQQILAGAPIDVFVSASRHWAEVIDQSDLAEATVDYLGNRLVLIARRGNPAGVNSIADLSNPSVQRVAVAGVAVPAGVLARQVLIASGQMEALREDRKIVTGSDVRVTLAYVQTGEADAGFVYATDALGCDDVVVVEVIPETLHDPIVYPVVLTRLGARGEFAREFFTFLQTAASKDVFTTRGFTVLPTNR